MGRFDAVDDLVRQLGEASWEQRDAIREALLALCQEFEIPKPVIHHLEDQKRTLEDLEARWEIDEVIEAITPVVEEEPAPEPEEAPDPGQPLTPADLVLILDDPRGVRLHKSKVGGRYFLTQVDPRTYQPQTFELRPEEVSQLKIQLANSPYWVPGVER